MHGTPAQDGGPRRAPLLTSSFGGLTLAAVLLAGCGDPGGVDSGYGAAPAPSTPAAASTAPGADDESAGTSDEAPAEEVVITIEGFAYTVPDSVPPGAQITVRNADGVGHTVTSDDGGATFDVPVGPGEEVTFTAPEEPGEVPFHCTPHPAMTATLVVAEEG